MRTLALSLSLLAGMSFAAMHASPAQALLSHTWVSSTGLDSNACDRANPCASFSGAYGKTNPGGEITCVDSGSYGGLTITMSLTINCESAIGSNTQPPSSVGQIGVNTAATDIVVLRGLDIDGVGITVAALAINFNGAGVLHLQKMKINNWRGAAHGIRYVPAGAAKLIISDSQITDNGASGVAAGIFIQPPAGVTANITIERTRIANNSFGIVADGSAGGTIRGVVQDSVVSGNLNNGITISSSGTSVVLAVDNTTVANNNFGLVATGTNAGMLVSRSFITANATGVFTASSGVILSYRDNRLNANTTADGVFTGPVGLQ